ncbi:MAG: hypothetical protein IPK87_10570 [Planctomycetes bacterium]|nr:hypothetical protein [Planctomycetota bacterium]
MIVPPQATQAAVQGQFAQYTNVTLPGDGQQVWQGRFILWAMQPMGPAAMWSIECLDRHGNRSDALEFDHDQEGGATVSGFKYMLTGGPVECGDVFVRFRFRRKAGAQPNHPQDPNDYYRIRAQWPWPASGTPALCEVRVRLGQQTAAPQPQPTPPAEPSYYGTPEQSQYYYGEPERALPPATRPGPRGGQTHAPGPIYLDQVIPPGPPGIGDRPLGASILNELISEEAKEKCRCQLIVWDPLQSPSDTPDAGKAQSEIPDEWKSLAIDRNDGTTLRGRFTLRGPVEETASSKKWRIEFLDATGTVTDSWEIRDAATSMHPWQPALEGSQPVRCENDEVSFWFRPRTTANPNDPDVPEQTYKIRAYWGESSASAQVSCEAKLRLNGLPCSCELTILDRPLTAIGHRPSPDNVLGFCPTLTQRACAFNETLALTLDLFGPTRPKGKKKYNIIITSRLGTRKDGIEKYQPLQFKRLDSKADDDGGRLPIRPETTDASGIQYWPDNDWMVNLTESEPCDSQPLRLLIKLSNDKDTLQLIGNELYQQIEDAGQLASAQVKSFLIVRDRELPNGSDVLCEIEVPLMVRGGLWVTGIPESSDYGAKILDALRRLWNPPGGLGDAPFGWIDGRPPEDGGVGQIVPTRMFPESEPTVFKGRQLVWRFLSGTCCGVIMPGGPDAWTPYNLNHAFARGDRHEVSAQHWNGTKGTPPTHRIRDCDGAEVPAPSKADKTTVHGTGKGVPGVVKVTGAVINDTFDKWTLFRPDTDAAGTRVWRMPRANEGKPVVTLARVLAHELAHLVQGCAGSSTIGLPIADDVPLTGEIGGRRWTATKEDFSGDKGEYDAIIGWENQIAIELGELPRFKHV